jgi:hypothetical protein
MPQVQLGDLSPELARVLSEGPQNQSLPPNTQPMPGYLDPTEITQLQAPAAQQTSTQVPPGFYQPAPAPAPAAPAPVPQNISQAQIFEQWKKEARSGDEAAAKRLVQQTEQWKKEARSGDEAAAKRLVQQTAAKDQVASTKQFANSQSIRATPQQATSELIGLANARAGIVEGEGSQQQKAGEALANTYLKDSNEKKQQAIDYSTFLKQAQQEKDRTSAQLQTAYDDYKKKAGSLQDPSSQYWGDKGMGARILSGFALFASGLGAGLQGKGGNPYLDYLDKQINNNFNQHKQNIKDLYDGAVAAGKVDDNAESWQKWLSDAQLKHYELASAHIIPELEGIKAQSTGQTQKNLADTTVNDIQQQIVGRKQALSQQEAAAATQSAAQQRARAAEVKTKYEAALKERTAKLEGGGTPEELANARVEAFRDVGAAGYTRSDLTGIAGGLGIPTNQKTGEFVLPAAVSPSQTGSGGASLDDKGNVVVPRIDANGHIIPAAERSKLEEDAKNRRIVDPETGQTRLAVNKDAVQKYNIHSEAYSAINQLLPKLEKAYKDGDVGTYQTLRRQIEEKTPQLYGFTRSGELGKGGEGGTGGAITGQLPPDVTYLQRLGMAPGWASKIEGSAAAGQKQIDAYKAQLPVVHQGMNTSTFGGAATKTETPAEKAARLGGTPAK